MAVRPAGARRPRGFTLVELVTTLIVVGTLAVVVLPRFADRRTFESRGFSDEALAALQYARKVAVAARRNVCAATAGSTLTLTMATLGGSVQPCTVAVPNPAGGNYAISPRHDDVAFGGTLNVAFDGQGRPLDGTSLAPLTVDATVVIAGGDARTLGVTAGTGYPYVR